MSNLFKQNCNNDKNNAKSDKKIYEFIKFDITIKLFIF